MTSLVLRTLVELDPMTGDEITYVSSRGEEYTYTYDGFLGNWSYEEERWYTPGQYNTVEPRGYRKWIKKVEASGD